ncbi:hypothetical protein DMC47_42685 [Nostoc sp. 3335mG]|nr:hypothetical protein DMC47_42685 [Nostoc sp. 3335mG]
MNEEQDQKDSRWATGNGVSVVGICGFFAISGFFLANRHMEAIDWILFALVAVLTIGGGFALSRLIRNNPGAIGEARFDTTNKTEDRDRP